MPSVIQGQVLAWDDTAKQFLPKTLEGDYDSRYVRKDISAPTQTMLAPLALPTNGLTVGTNQLVVTSIGAGVGTNAPSNLLTVNQSGNSTAGVNASYGIALSVAGTSCLGIGSDLNYVYLESWASKPLYINTYGNDVILNYTAGNVGVGCTPSYKLHVAGTICSSTGGFRFPNGTTQTTANNLPSKWMANGTNIYYNSGNAGLGTANPSGNLDIERAVSDGGVILRLGILESGTTNFDFSRDPPTGALRLQGNQAGYNNIALAPTSGNVGIRTMNPIHPLHLGSDAHCTAAGVWTNASSRSIKTDFITPDWSQMLSKIESLDMKEYRYKTELNVRHLTPFAEDFHEAFKLGSDDKTLSPADVAGIALGGVKGLLIKIKELENKIAVLERSRPIR